MSLISFSSAGEEAEMNDFVGGVYDGDGTYATAGNVAVGAHGAIIKAGDTYFTPNGVYVKAGDSYISPRRTVVRAGDSFVGHDNSQVKAGDVFCRPGYGDFIWIYVLSQILGKSHIFDLISISII